ncbi:MAG: hypothetical protein ABI851_10975 [Saprospiraceae bacterium]
MKISYINSTLKSLNKREMGSFLNFLSADFINRDPIYVQFAKILYKHINFSDNANYDKFEIFKLLYPKKEFNDLKLRHTIARFKKLLEEFLVLNHYRTNKPLLNKALLHVLRKKNLKHNFRQTINKINVSYTMNSQVSIIDPSLEKYFVSKEEYEFDHEYKRNTKDNIRPMLTSLEHFYLLENLRLACLDWINYKLAHDKEYFQSRINNLLKNYDPSTFEEKSTMNLFLQMYYLIFDQKSARSFIDISDFLRRIENELLFEDKKTAYLLLLNYCIQLSNQGNITFTKHALDQYKIGINNKVLLEKGTLSPYTYKNVVILLLTLEKYEETKEFMDSFKKFLPSEIGQNSYQFNLALLLFKQNDFDNAMQLMANTSFIDEYDDLSARRMLIRIYFEKKEWNALHSLLDSFEIYLKRKKNLGYHKESYILLIRYARKILAVKNNDKKNAKKLHLEITKSPNFPEKNWLMYKVDEIMHHDIIQAS